MAGGFPRDLLRLFKRFPMVGDPPDSESVSSTFGRVLLKAGITTWERGGGEGHSSHLFVMPPHCVASPKTSQDVKGSGAKPQRDEVFGKSREYFSWQLLP